MSMRALFVTAVIIFLCTMSSASTAQESTSDCPGSHKHSHVNLLFYAALAEMAYESSLDDQHDLDPYKYCPAGTHRPEPRPVNLMPVPGKLVFTGVDRLDRLSTCDLIILVDSSNNEEFITCRRRTTSLDRRLAVAFRYIRDDSDRRLSLLAKIAVIVTSLTEGERLRLNLIRFRHSDETRADSDEIFGVQGTDIFSLPQWKTSIQNLLGDSCLFDVAVSVATEFFGSPPDNASEYSHAIVGHSLGGAVAQHAAIDEHVNLGAAYSFNSVGVAQNAVQNASTRRVKSVRLAGELLENEEPGFRTTQIGHQFRYEVPPPPGPLGLMRRIQRHKIWKVQQGICRCLVGTGNFEYRPPINPGN